MPDPASVQAQIRATALQLGVPPELALAVAEQESSFNPDALGPVIQGGPARGQRAVGTFQIVPSTAQMLGIDPSNPDQNIKGGVKYLQILLASHRGDIEKVLKTYGGVVDDTTYVPQVMGRMQKFTDPQAGPVNGRDWSTASQSTAAQPGPSEVNINIGGPEPPGGRSTLGQNLPQLPADQGPRYGAKDFDFASNAKAPIQSQEERRVSYEQNAQQLAEATANRPPVLAGPRTAAAFLVRGASGLVPGGPWGAAAGATGELVAQTIEPGRREYNIPQVLTQGGLGLIPFGTYTTPLRAAAKGGTMGLGATVATQQAERGLHIPDREDVPGMAFGTALGSAGGYAAGRWFPGKPPEPPPGTPTPPRHPSYPNASGVTPPPTPPAPPPAFMRSGATATPAPPPSPVVPRTGERPPATGEPFLRPSGQPGDAPLAPVRQTAGEGGGLVVPQPRPEIDPDAMRRAALAELREYRMNPGSFTPERAQALADNLIAHIGTPNAQDIAAEIYRATPKSVETSGYAQRMRQAADPTLTDSQASQLRRAAQGAQHTREFPEREPGLAESEAGRIRREGEEQVGTQISGQEPQPVQPPKAPVEPIRPVQAVQPPSGPPPGATPAPPRGEPGMFSGGKKASEQTLGAPKTTQDLRNIGRARRQKGKRAQVEEDRTAVAVEDDNPSVLPREPITMADIQRRMEAESGGTPTRTETPTRKADVEPPPKAPAPPKVKAEVPTKAPGRDWSGMSDDEVIIHATNDVPEAIAEAQRRPGVWEEVQKIVGDEVEVPTGPKPVESPNKPAEGNWGKTKDENVIFMAKRGNEAAVNEAKRRGIWERISQKAGEIEKRASERIDKRGTFKGGTAMMPILPVGDIADLVTIGAAKITKGVADFAQWSTEMVAKYGDGIKPHLDDIFKQSMEKASKSGEVFDVHSRSRLGRIAPEWRRKIYNNDTEAMLRYNEKPPKEDDVLNWVREQLDNGEDPGQVWTAVKDAYRNGVDPSYSDDITDLGDYIRDIKKTNSEPPEPPSGGGGRRDVPSPSRGGAEELVGKAKEVGKKLRDVGKRVKDIAGGKSVGEDIGAKDKTYLREDYTMSMNEELSRMGKEGKEIFRRIAKADHLERQYNARWANKYKEATEALTDAEVKSMVGAIKYGTKPLNDNVAKAADEVRSIFREISQEAKARNIARVSPKGKRTGFKEYSEDFWPEYTTSSHSELIQKLQTPDPISGAKLSPGEAKKIAKMYREYGADIFDLGKGKGAGTFDFKHTRDAGQLHIEGMARLIARTRTLGNRGLLGTADGIKNLIESTPDPARTLKLLKRQLGQEMPDISKAAQNTLRKARTFQVWTKLQNFAIANVLGGQTNIILRSSPKVYLQEVTKYLKRDLEQRAITSISGAQVEISHGMLEELGKINPTRLYGIKMTENINRTIAAGVGRGMAREHFKALKMNPSNQLARKRLGELALEDVDKLLKQNELTESQLMIAAGRMAEITQGLNVNRNLPYRWSSTAPGVQLATMFKKYAFQGTKATWDAIKQDPKKNIPIFLALSQITGMTIGASKAVTIGAWKSLFDQEDFGESIKKEVGGRGERLGKTFGIENTVTAQILDNAFQSYAFGLPASIVEAAAYGRSGLADLAGGPITGDVFRLGEDAFKIGTGRVKQGMRDVAKFGARSLPLPMGGGQALGSSELLNEDSGSRPSRGSFQRPSR